MASSDLRRSPSGTTLAIDLADEEELDDSARPPPRVALAVREPRVLGGIVTIHRNRNQVVHGRRPRMGRAEFPIYALSAKVTAPTVADANLIDREAARMLSPSASGVLDAVVIAGSFVPARVAEPRRVQPFNGTRAARARPDDRQGSPWGGTNEREPAIVRAGPTEPGLDASGLELAMTVRAFSQNYGPSALSPARLAHSLALRQAALAAPNQPSAGPCAQDVWFPRHDGLPGMRKARAGETRAIPTRR